MKYGSIPTTQDEENDILDDEIPRLVVTASPPTPRVMEEITETTPIIRIAVWVWVGVGFWVMVALLSVVGGNNRWIRMQ